MSDHLDSEQDPSAEELAVLEVLLSRPELWDDPPAGLEDSIVTAIIAEAASDGYVAAPTALTDRRANRRTKLRIWVGAAAAAVVVVVGVTIATRGSDDATVADGLTMLTGTDLAPTASASVTTTATPAGLKMILATSGLGAAPEGFMYEAWVGNGSIRVSAGTFHLKGGEGPIALWAGVDDPSFDQLSVTLEPIDGIAESSGQAVLRGHIAFD